MSSYTIFADKIFYFENVLENPQEIIQLLESTDQDLTEDGLITQWQEWKSSNDDYQFGHRKSTSYEAYDSASIEVKHIYDSLQKALNLAGNQYTEALGIELGSQAPISISKYNAGAHMGPHADEGMMAHISAVLYLNDNFSDGGLEFPNQEVFIKPSAGSIIIFPSVQPYVHDPKPASEIKYISPAFWFIENSPLISA